MSKDTENTLELIPADTGMDVQDTLINATPEEVRREVRLMRDTFDSPSGGFLYASGNGIVGGTPIDNIEAFLDECIRYRNDI